MKNANLFISMLVASTLPACGYIKSLFPDKEKDYQYTTEIPALVLPPDLGRENILKPPPAVAAAPSGNMNVDSPAASAAKPATVEHPAVDSRPPASPVATTTVAEQAAIVDTPVDNTDAPVAADTAAPLAKHEFIAVELIKAADGNSRLRVSAPFDKAWRTVDKALSRKSIEVTSRNKQESAFKLHYDPNEKKLEDGSLWDEALFIFSGLQGDEKEFVVKLIDNGQQTDVVILDTAQHPAADAAALNLLNLLQETIKTDFAK
ncbi:MAG: outer membrane protein assembly factor BamC [Methylovulum sp.]|nr:MAG: outer membrane protein assembly factor BamC [Methylovulum sp.]